MIKLITNNKTKNSLRVEFAPMVAIDSEKNMKTEPFEQNLKQTPRNKNWKHDFSNTVQCELF